MNIGCHDGSRSISVAKYKQINARATWRHSLNPPRRIDGRVDDKSDALDASDVDQGQQLTWYKLSIEPGDSGAAIYGEDGRVVGLVTYEFPSEGAGGFALAFSEKAIEIAQVDLAPY
jgi:hypothetical protein